MTEPETVEKATSPPVLFLVSRPSANPQPVAKATSPTPKAAPAAPPTPKESDMSLTPEEVTAAAVKLADRVSKYIDAQLAQVQKGTYPHPALPALTNNSFGAQEQAQASAMAHALGLNRSVAGLSSQGGAPIDTTAVSKVINDHVSAMTMAKNANASPQQTAAMMLGSEVAKATAVSGGALNQEAASDLEAACITKSLGALRALFSDGIEVARARDEDNRGLFRPVGATF